MQTAQALSEKIGKREACVVLGIPRSSLHRSTQPRKEPIRPQISARAPSTSEKEAIRAELNSVRFQDCALQMSQEMGYHWGKVDAEEVMNASREG